MARHDRPLFLAVAVLAILSLAGHVTAETYCADGCGIKVVAHSNRGVNWAYGFKEEILVWFNVVSYTVNTYNVSINGTDQYELVETISNRTFRAPFFPRIDQFSQLQIKNTGYSYYRNETTRVWLSVLGVASPMRAYTDGDSYIPFYSAVIVLNAGRVSSIYWDEGCNDCGNPCVANTCATRYGTNYSPCLTDECNIKTYLAFSGTTRAGRALVSTGLLPSNFRRFALGSLQRDFAQVTGAQLANLRDDNPSSSTTNPSSGSVSGSATGTTTTATARASPTSTSGTGTGTGSGEVWLHAQADGGSGHAPTSSAALGE